VTSARDLLPRPDHALEPSPSSLICPVAMWTTAPRPLHAEDGVA
jgi:hypothetical protein